LFVSVKRTLIGLGKNKTKVKQALAKLLFISNYKAHSTIKLIV